MRLGIGLHGETNLGADPPPPGPTYQRVEPPPAMYFDPASRDFLQDAAGRILDMGTINQKVALAFSVPRGALRHATEIGHDFMTLPRIAGAALDAEIDRRAAAATPFDQLLSAGLVELLGVDKQHPKTTETRLVIKWRLTNAQDTRTTVVGTG